MLFLVLKQFVCLFPFRLYDLFLISCGTMLQAYTGFMIEDVTYNNIFLVTCTANGIISRLLDAVHFCSIKLDYMLMLCKP